MNAKHVKHAANAGHTERAVQRALAALALSSAALGLAAGAAHADNATLQAAAPLATRVGDAVDHPDQAVQDAKTALEVTGTVAGAAVKSTETSLAGTGGALRTGPQALPAT
ncbi:hypothetical protein HYE82_33405 [Streptomyces sp. BR123]|uniref:hypothetical protein n=1 Tax=Streptomyces sp. BR123 TaxID=2749828 RepID=UPI0015C4925E|nr:hypothetical protein [Streptomyces sp. BR123]NXY99193.1 hypothetical protein [Streptomyces sp. BR123]